MSNKALVVIDLQNDITKNYREIVDQINKAVDWAVGNALTSKTFAAFIQERGITKFYIVGADATACIKYDKKKLPEMLEYYEQKGCSVESFNEVRI